MIAKGLEDVSKLQNLTINLVARGFTDNEIKGILGKNFLRYMKKIF
jgi:microsomal dipeptidase-like Zn-dependent dipeptidase